MLSHYNLATAVTLKHHAADTENVSYDVVSSHALHAVVTGGAGMSLAFIALFNALGYFPYSVQALLPTVLATSLVATAVESLPINQTLDDNFSVPAITAVMGHLLLQAIQQSGGLT